MKQQLRHLAARLRYLKGPPGELSADERRSHERYQRIVWSAATGSMNRIVAALMGAISVPLLVGYLGKDRFGLWMLVSSLILWMQLTDFGIGNGLTNAVAEANGRGDREAAQGYLSAALVASLVLATICSFPLYGAYLWLPWGELLNSEASELTELAASLFLLSGSAFLLNLPLSLASRVYVAYQRSYVPNVLQAVSSVVVFGLLAWGVRERLNILWLVGFTAFVPLLANLAMWAGLRTAGLPGSFVPGVIKRGSFARVSTSSVPFLVFQLGGLLVNQLVNVVVAGLASLALVSDYNVVLRVYSFIFVVAAAVSTPYLAAIREAFERRETAWVRKAIRQSLTFRLLMMLPFALLWLFYGDRLLVLWIGDLAPAALGVTGWTSVVLCMVLSATSSHLSDVLSSLDDIWSQVGLVMLTAFVVLVSMHLLIPRLGITGVFIAMSLSTVLPIVYLLTRLRRRLSASADDTSPA